MNSKEVKKIVEHFEYKTGYTATIYAVNSIKTISLKYDIDTIMEAIDIVYEKYNIETYNDFFALVHGICKSIYNEPRKLEKLNK